MTKLPNENQNVVGLAGPNYPRYKVGPLCSAPGCSKIADHAHHIWRRSFLTGDYAWVRLWDGKEMQNLTGLCWRHHEDITLNKAAIVWSGNFFFWRDQSEMNGINLDPQPRTLGQAEQAVMDATPAHSHVGPATTDKCPTCNRAVKTASEKKEAKRHREKWSITVPVDARENGADVLDTLLLSCAELFGHDEDASAVRYHTLVQALALVVQHGDRMVADA